ncbi:hypothetical protein Tco_0036637, partial [Tanacetum coccineum]
SGNMPTLYYLSSFELIAYGTPNLYTMCSYANFYACFSFFIVKGFASTHLVECSTAMARNFKLSGVIGRGPRMLTPQWLNGHVFPAAMTSFPDTFFAIYYSWHRVQPWIIFAESLYPCFMTVATIE